jgi:hypothetical protein
MSGSEVEVELDESVVLRCVVAQSKSVPRGRASRWSCRSGRSAFAPMT